MKLKLSLAAVAVIAAAIGFLLWQKAAQTAALVAKATPTVPEAQISNPELLTRIQEATTQARAGQLEGLAELSRLYHANGFNNEAWQCYAALVLADPGQAQWPYHFGRILAGYGKLEEATPLFERAVSLDSNYIPSRIRLGDTLLKQNLYSEAQDSYEGTLALDEQNPYALLGLARVAIGQENWQQARIHLEKAVEVSDYQIGADLLGDVYEKLDLPALENSVLQKIEWGSYSDMPDPWSLSLMDDSYDAYQVSIAGGWVAHRGDIRTGLRYIRRAVELDPNSSTLQYQIAGIYHGLEDFEKAEEHYRRCVELQPDLADAWLGLVEIAKRRNSPTLVRRTLDAALRAAPDSPSLNIERGKILVAQKQFSKAYPYFEKSIEHRPHEAVGYIELAQAYLAANRIEDGVEQLRLALIREPNNPIALSSMVFDAIMRKDKAEADAWFERLRQQARFGADERAQLESLYQNAFGSRP